MTDAPAYVMRRMTMANSTSQIGKALGDAINDGHHVPTHIKLGTKAVMIEALDRIIAGYWDAQARPAKTKKKSDLCKITAEECNAWLRTLPPLPHAYDEPGEVTAK